MLLGSRKAHTRYGMGPCGAPAFLTLTMSYWSSGLTVCFPPQGASVCTLGVQPTLWNRDYLFAPSGYTLSVFNSSKSNLKTCTIAPEA
jgi:hypothetical protein